MTMTHTPMRELVYDRLLIEGGWLCASELALMVGVPESTANRTLYRLRSQGRARSRRVELAYAGGGRHPGRLDCRTEWQAVEIDDD